MDKRSGDRPDSLHDEQAPGRRSVILRLAAPPAIAGVYLALLAAFLPLPVFMATAGLMGAYFIPPAGRESLIPFAIAIGLPWWLIALSLSLIDVLTALVIAVNLDLASRIPVIGDWLERITEETEEYLADHPMLRDFSFFGLVVFIFAPVTGSGGIGGSVVGRLIGLSPARVVAAMALGSGLSCFLIALGGEYVRGSLEGGGMMVLIAVSILVAAGTGISLLYYRRKRRTRRRLMSPRG